MLPPNQSYRAFWCQPNFLRTAQPERRHEPLAAETGGERGGLVGEGGREREVAILQRGFGLVGEALRLIVLRPSFGAETPVVHAAQTARRTSEQLAHLPLGR